jgi:hypothetical protein
MAKTRKTSKQTALNYFIGVVADKEKGKKSISVGNIRETLKIVNEALDGEVYKLIDKKYNDIEGGDFENITL